MRADREYGKNREAVLAEVRRRWQERDPTPFLPNFAATVETETPKRASKEKEEMSKVRVLVGTRKGAFVLTADGKRENGTWMARTFAGWEIYHVKGSPADPNRLYRLSIERLVRTADPTLG